MGVSGVSVLGIRHSDGGTVVDGRSSYVNWRSGARGILKKKNNKFDRKGFKYLGLAYDSCD